MAITDAEIWIEYEADLCLSGEPEKTCPKCGLQTYRKTCPVCRDNIPLTGDAVIDSLFDKLDNGEKVDWNELRKPSQPVADIQDEEFEILIPGQR